MGNGIVLILDQKGRRGKAPERLEHPVRGANLEARDPLRQKRRERRIHQGRKGANQEERQDEREELGAPEEEEKPGRAA